MAQNNRYATLIEDIFKQYYIEGKNKVVFKRNDIELAAAKLNIKLPKNLGDVIYSFKFRTNLPEYIAKTSSDGREWVIKNIGRGLYAFEQVKNARIIPD